jgi:DNA-binding XRE family transcriptional regulator
MPPKLDGEPEIHSSIGARIKERRREVNLTLDELANETGLTASFISQVERGKVSLSLNSLQALAKALNVSVLYFMAEGNGSKFPSQERSEAEPPAAQPVAPYCPVVYPGRRIQLVFPATGVKLEFLVPSLGRKMIAFKGRLEPGKFHLASRLREPTEEMIYVLSGALKLEFTDGSYTLHPDESIYFEGESLLKMTGASENEDTVWLSVITPSVF